MAITGASAMALPLEPREEQKAWMAFLNPKEKLGGEVNIVANKCINIPDLNDGKWFRTGNLAAIAYFPVRTSHGAKGVKLTCSIYSEPDCKAQSQDVARSADLTRPDENPFWKDAKDVTKLSMLCKPL